MCPGSQVGDSVYRLRSTIFPRPFSTPTSPARVQLDLFPEQFRIQRLDPREVAGANTRVDAIFVVRFEWERSVHQVFKDHYGLYCADHGRLCRAVSAVTAQYGSGSHSKEEGNPA